MAKRQRSSKKKLGHDPFKDMDLDWLEEEKEPQPLEQDLASPTAIPEPIPSALPPTAAATPSRPEATLHFPADFKWGVATAAHQVEGNNTNNDWWAWEQEGGHIKDGQQSKRACNWWENAEADFDRAAGLGLGAMRISVEWSRIEPQPGEFDDAALVRYSEMLQALRERQIEPMVTLHHFSNPLWLAERGGWENPATIDLFLDYSRRVAEALSPYCDLWCTINEPNVYGLQSYMDGVWPPGKTDQKAAFQVIRHLLMAHAAAYREIHQVQPNARVGLAHNMRILDPANPDSRMDRRTAQFADTIFNQAILTALSKGRWMPPLGFGSARRLKGTLDWIGLNYYTRELIAFDRAHRESFYIRRQFDPDAEMLDGNYGEFYPEGIFRCIERLSRLDLPIYVTENGIPDDDDDQRPRYLLTHLHKIWHAIQLCYPVMGYYHWTLVDNFEWAEGWSLRFGLFALSLKNKSRKARPSAQAYADIIQANAITPQIIDAHTPELRDVLLPG
jgi:beta-glucosidase